IANADLLPRDDHARCHQCNRERLLVAHDLGIGLVRVVAERDYAEDDARTVLSLAKAKIVITQTGLRDSPGIGVVVDDHRAGDDLAARRDNGRGDQTASFDLEIPNLVHEGFAGNNHQAVTDANNDHYEHGLPPGWARHGRVWSLKGVASRHDRLPRSDAVAANRATAARATSRGARFRRHRQRAAGDARGSTVGVRWPGA